MFYKNKSRLPLGYVNGMPLGFPFGSIDVPENKTIYER